MKRLLLLLLAAGTSFAQQLPGDFEVFVEGLFEDLPYTDFAVKPPPVEEPIRNAVVEVRLGGVLMPVVGKLDDTGKFQATFPNVQGPRNVTVRILAQDGDGRAEVRKYAMTPNTFTSGALHQLTGQALNANSGVVVALTAKEADVAPAFHCLEMAQRAHEFANQFEATLPLAKVHWKRGLNITTGYFWQVDAIVIEDSEVVYGDGVVPEEVGHLYQDVVFQSISSAGDYDHMIHSNPMHALTEGWANWFAHSVLGSHEMILPTYYRWNVEIGVEYQPGFAYPALIYDYGSDSENAVAMCLWDMTDAPEDDNDQHVCPPQMIWDAAKGLTQESTFEDFCAAHPHSQDESFLNVLRSRVMEFVPTPNTIIYYADGGVDKAILEGVDPGVSHTIQTSNLTVGLVLDYAGAYGMKHASPPLCPWYAIDHPDPGELEVVLRRNAVQTQHLLHLGQFYEDYYQDQPGEKDGRYCPPGYSETWSDLTTWGGDPLAPWLQGWDPSGWNQIPLGSSWTLEATDAVANGVTGDLRGARIWITPQDFSDRDQFEAWAENTNYEWLGEYASHEYKFTDPRDTDGMPNAGDHDLGDDGMWITYDEPSRTFTYVAKVSTSGARNARYRNADGSDKYLRVHVWTDHDDSGFDASERVELFPLGGSADGRCPRHWPRGQNHAYYIGTYTLPPSANDEFEMWIRARLTYDALITPEPLVGTPFGEVEDYHLRPGDDYVPPWEDELDPNDF